MIDGCLRSSSMANSLPAGSSCSTATFTGIAHALASIKHRLKSSTSLASWLQPLGKCAIPCQSNSLCSLEWGTPELPHPKGRNKNLELGLSEHAHARTHARTRARAHTPRLGPAWHSYRGLDSVAKPARLEVSWLTQLWASCLSCSCVSLTFHGSPGATLFLLLRRSTIAAAHVHCATLIHTLRTYRTFPTWHHLNLNILHVRCINNTQHYTMLH